MTDGNQAREDLIAHWRRSLSILHTGHWRAARRYDVINLALGTCAVVAAAVAGSTAFGDLVAQGLAKPTAQFLVGWLAVVAAALSAVQTFFRASDLAAKHRQAGVKFGQLERELEGYIDVGISEDPQDREKLLKPFHARWNQAEDEALPLPQRIYNSAEREEYRKSERQKEGQKPYGDLKATPKG